MKRLAFGVAAVALVLASQQQASAWSKFNFGVGLNVGWQGGGNSVLWGVLKGAPTPGDGGYGDGGGPGLGGALALAPALALGPLPSPSRSSRTRNPNPSPRIRAALTPPSPSATSPMRTPRLATIPRAQRTQRTCIPPIRTRCITTTRFTGGKSHNQAAASRRSFSWGAPAFCAFRFGLQKGLRPVLARTALDIMPSSEIPARNSAIGSPALTGILQPIVGASCFGAEGDAVCRQTRDGFWG